MTRRKKSKLKIKIVFFSIISLLTLNFIVNYAFIPNPNKVLTISDSNENFIPKTAQENIWNYTTGNDVRSVDVSGNGQYIVAGSHDGKIYFFDSDSNVTLWTYNTGAELRSVAISENGSYIIGGAANGWVYCFYKSTNQTIWNYSLSGQEVLTVAISEDGQYMAAGGRSNIVYFFNNTPADPKSALWSYNTGDDVWAIDLCYNGSYIVVGNGFGWLFLFDSSIGSPKNYIWRDTTVGGHPWTVSISDNGFYIASGGYGDATNNNISLYCRTSGEPIWTYGIGSAWVQGVSISGDGKYIAASARENYRVYLFNATKITNPLIWYDNLGDYVWCVDISKNGEYIIAGTYDVGSKPQIYIYEKASNTPLCQYAAPGSFGIWSVAASRSGNYFVAGTYADKIQTYHQSVPLPPESFQLHTNAGSPDTDGNFNLYWDVSTNALNYSLYWSQNPITDVDYANLIVSGNTNRTYDIKGKTDGSYHYIVMAFNDDGNHTSNCLPITVQTNSNGEGNDDDDTNDDDKGPTSVTDFLFSLPGVIIIGSVSGLIVLGVVFSVKKRRVVS